MRQGCTVYFIKKGVVRSGILVKIKDGVALIKYTNGIYSKYYRHKVCQIATELEGGKNGRLSNGSDTSSNKGCDTKNNKVLRENKPDSKGQKTSDKVFVGAWRIRNMA